MRTTYLTTTASDARSLQGTHPTPRGSQAPRKAIERETEKGDGSSGKAAKCRRPSNEEGNQKGTPEALAQSMSNIDIKKYGIRWYMLRFVFVISTAVILNGSYNYTNANVYT